MFHRGGGRAHPRPGRRRSVHARTRSGRAQASRGGARAGSGSLATGTTRAGRVAGWVMTANLRNQRATALPIGDHQEVVVTSESPTFRPAAQLRNLARYSYVLGNLVRKDLKVKYTSSVLGAVWSMLNPLAYLLI